MSADEKSFTELAGVPVWYHERDKPDPGDEKIFRRERTYKCTQDLYERLSHCFDELFKIWPLETPAAILTMGTLGDGENAHGKGNAFDLSGFELSDGTVCRVFDYPDWKVLLDGINAHLFLYFPQVLNHFYPKHRDHFHVDTNFADRNHYRPGSTAQTFFVQAVLRHAFGQDLGSGGRYGDGVDGKLGGKTKKALDEIMYRLELTGGGGLTNGGVWTNFVLRARSSSFDRFKADHGIAPAGAAAVALPAGAVAPVEREFRHLEEKVHDRGEPPKAFLEELIDWALAADDEIFDRNESLDVYSKIVGELGPWADLRHRKAALCEVLRVLGGFESSWNWDEGRDMSANNTDHDTMESGIFQCSSNSISFFKDDPYQEEIFQILGRRQRGPERSRAFIEKTKKDHGFALEYCARLLRKTTDHHGPVKHYRGHIYQGKFQDGIGNHLSRAATNEFLSFF